MSVESVMTSSESAPACATVSPTNPVPTSMLSFRFATPNNAQTPYYISSDIVLSGGIAQQNRRRIVHNEVEKRRKDKITNWIKKLSDLLPRHRVLKQSKNYVLESACEYITELREMSSQFGQLKSSKQKLEQEVAELKNKVNKLEDENKRLSQLIHQNNVAIPTTWSDSSVITATMRATSRSCNTEMRTVPSDNTSSTLVSSVPAITASNRLSVNSILSSHQPAGVRPAISATVSTMCSPVITNTITRNVLPSTVLVTPTSLAIQREPLQVVAQPYSIPSILNGQYHQQTVFTAPTSLRSVQDNIPQLPYSIEALTGTSRTQGAQLLSFSAESLIGRHDSTNEMVMITNPSNQPIIENTFTLSHPENPTHSSPPQTFSNFSALSLVGGTAPFSTSSTTSTLPRSINTDTDATPHSTNQMFTDFSTESLISSNEFSSDFAIDNLISRSDSNVHMAAVNPNLIQSFGKGNDPMISSVCGDHGSQSSSLHDGLPYLPFSNSFGNIGQTRPDQTNVPLYPNFSTILSPPLFSRPLETGQRQGSNVNSTNFFSGSFPTPFQVS